MIEKVKQGGSLANKNGKILEETLIPAFRKNGYIVISGNDKKYNEIIEKESKIVVKNAPYKSIYGHNGKTEFLLINKDINKNIRIECKWQQSAGSVDEKLPYLYLNCVFSFKEKDIIIIIDGGGQKQGAIDWLKKMVSDKWLSEDKNIKIMNVSEFLAWFNNLNK